MASPNRTLRWILVILRLALGAIFLYAAWVKLSLPWQLFAMAIDSYQLLPPGPVEFLARTLPAFELLLGVALIVGGAPHHERDHVGAAAGVFQPDRAGGAEGPGDQLRLLRLGRNDLVEDDAARRLDAGGLAVPDRDGLAQAGKPAPPSPAALPLDGTPPEPSPNLPPSESR